MGNLRSIVFIYNTPLPTGRVVVNIGRSSHFRKTVSASQHDLDCPRLVSRRNWLGTGTFFDVFRITVNGYFVTAERIDAAHGE